MSQIKCHKNCVFYKIWNLNYWSVIFIKFPLKYGLWIFDSDRFIFQKGYCYNGKQC